jgi:hypothetical protein
MTTQDKNTFLWSLKNRIKLIVAMILVLSHKIIATISFIKRQTKRD